MLGVRECAALERACGIMADVSSFLEAMVSPPPRPENKGEGQTPAADAAGLRHRDVRPAPPLRPRSSVARRGRKALLIRWCWQSKTKYSQGLNEVLAPLVWESCCDGSHHGWDDDEVFDRFWSFSCKFTPFVKHDMGQSMHNGAALLGHLLRHHRPDFFDLLIANGMMTITFCVPWFLTAFASKNPIRIAVAMF